MKKFSSVVLTGVLLGAAFGASANCEKPAAPVLPDPSSAVTPQMVKAKNEVQEYISKAEAYLACVGDTAKHNQMVDEMKEIADTFNGAIRAFKERMSNA